VGGQYGPHAFKARMVPRSAGFFFGSPASVLFRKYLAMKSPSCPPCVVARRCHGYGYGASSRLA